MLSSTRSIASCLNVKEKGYVLLAFLYLSCMPKVIDNRVMDQPFPLAQYYVEFAQELKTQGVDDWMLEEVSIQGQDKVFKDVIEPLESVSVNLIETNKQDIRELGSPKEVAEALIKKVLAPPSQKTKLIDASEHEVDGKVYYSFEFIAKAPNFTRHALGTVCIGNGKFYTLTTGSNERRWEKMKDKLHAVIDSFKLSTV